MDILRTEQSQPAELREDKAIIDALHTDNQLPGLTDTDAIFLMHLDVPDAILKKLHAH